MTMPDDPSDNGAPATDQPNDGTSRESSGPDQPAERDSSAARGPAGQASDHDDLPLDRVESRSMPELGALPLRGHRVGHRRVVRLVSTTPGADLSIELLPGLNKIGRQREDNHIVLVSPQVSRFHAELEVSERNLLLRDLGSGNGTYLNGSRISEHVLEAGDLIAFSDRFTFRVMLDLATQPPETLTLDGIPTPTSGTPAPSRRVRADSVPASLAERTEALKRSSPGLDTETLRALSDAAPPVRVAPRKPVEISARTATASPIDGTQPGAAAAAQAGQKASPRVRPVPTPISTSTAPQGGESAESPPHENPPHSARTTWPGIQASSPTAPTLKEVPIVGASGATSGDPTQLAPSAAPSAAASTEQPEGADPDTLEQEKRRLSLLYQVSKRCMSATSLNELDAALINVLERTTAFDRGFVTYQLTSGEWKLVMSPKGDRWERRTVRQLLQLALRSAGPVNITDSQLDQRLGSAPDGRSDHRLLLPLRSPESSVGAIFLVSAQPHAFEGEIVDFLGLFSDIAALAISNVARRET